MRLLCHINIACSFVVLDDTDHHKNTITAKVKPHFSGYTNEGLHPFRLNMRATILATSSFPYALELYANNTDKMASDFRLPPSVCIVLENL